MSAERALPPIDTHAERSPKPSPHSGDAPAASPSTSVSVVIPVFNGAGTLEGAVSSVLAQQLPPGEILLIDDGSTDGSATLLAGLASGGHGLRALSNGRNLGLAATLNRGLRESRGEFVLVLHQDCALEGEDWLARALVSFEDPAVVEVSGVPRHDVTEMAVREREFWIIRQHTANPGNSARAPGAPDLLFSENKCDVFRREDLLALGGFDQRLKEGGEDQVLAWRLRSTRWRVEYRYDLTFRVSLAQGNGLAPHLRRERSYGRQMRQILGITGFRALRRSPGGSTDPRLKNRVAAIAWILVSVAGLVGLALTLDPWFAAVVLVPPALRWIQFLVRAARVRMAYRLSPASVLATATVGLAADLAYALGTVTPAPRGPGARDDTKSG